MGRPLGSREVEVSQLKRLVELFQSDDNYTRTEMAEETGISKSRIYYWANAWELGNFGENYRHSGD